MKNDIVKGDYVRLVFPSYYELGKSSYNNSRFMQQPQDDLEVVMLGGRYQVNDIVINQWKVKMYELLYLDNKVNALMSGNLLKKDTDKMKCPFQIGENVVFNPNFSEKDEAYIMGFFPFKQQYLDKKPLIIEKKINDIYLIVKNSDSEVFKFPLLWTDFVRFSEV